MDKEICVISLGVFVDEWILRLSLLFNSMGKVLPILVHQCEDLRWLHGIQIPSLQERVMVL